MEVIVSRTGNMAELAKDVTFQESHVSLGAWHQQGEPIHLSVCDTHWLSCSRSSESEPMRWQREQSTP